MRNKVEISRRDPSRMGVHRKVFNSQRSDRVKNINIEIRAGGGGDCESTGLTAIPRGRPVLYELAVDPSFIVHIVGRGQSRGQSPGDQASAHSTGMSRNPHQHASLGTSAKEPKRVQKGVRVYWNGQLKKSAKRVEGLPRIWFHLDGFNCMRRTSGARCHCIDTLDAHSGRAGARRRLCRLSQASSDILRALPRRRKRIN
jgi:hypothetical protein